MRDAAVVGVVFVCVGFIRIGFIDNIGFLGSFGLLPLPLFGHFTVLSIGSLLA